MTSITPRAKIRVSDALAAAGLFFVLPIVAAGLAWRELRRPRRATG
jgi:hypothetical protein